MSVVTKLAGIQAVQIIPSLITGSGTNFLEESRYTISMETDSTLRVCKGSLAAEIRVLNIQQNSIAHLAMRQQYLQARHLVADYYQGLEPASPEKIEQEVCKIAKASVLSRKFYFWLATFGLEAGLSFDEYRAAIGCENALRNRLWMGVRRDVIPKEFTPSLKFVTLSRIAFLSREVYKPNTHTILKAEVYQNQLTMFVLAAGVYTEYRLKVEI